MNNEAIEAIIALIINIPTAYKELNEHITVAEIPYIKISINLKFKSYK